jgi:hypothetical protein
MTSTANVVILVLALATATLGYLYYQGRQSTIEIKLPTVKVDRP